MSLQAFYCDAVWNPILSLQLKSSRKPILGDGINFAFLLAEASLFNWLDPKVTSVVGRTRRQLWFKHTIKRKPWRITLHSLLLLLLFFVTCWLFWCHGNPTLFIECRSTHSIYICAYCVRGISPHVITLWKTCTLKIMGYIPATPLYSFSLKGNLPAHGKSIPDQLHSGMSRLKIIFDCQTIVLISNYLFDLPSPPLSVIFFYLFDPLFTPSSWLFHMTLWTILNIYRSLNCNLGSNSHHHIF